MYSLLQLNAYILCLILDGIIIDHDFTIIKSCFISIDVFLIDLEPNDILKLLLILIFLSH